MGALFHSTLDCVKTRKQLGVPIGSFQVLQHRLVDMHMALEQTRPLLVRALCSADATGRWRWPSCAARRAMERANERQTNLVDLGGGGPGGGPIPSSSSGSSGGSPSSPCTVCSIGPDLSTVLVCFSRVAVALLFSAYIRLSRPPPPAWTVVSTFLSEAPPLISDIR